MPESVDLSAFSRRVRLLSAWRGFALGLVAGSLWACLVVAVDRLRGHPAPWLHAALSTGAGCLLGAAVFAIRPIRVAELADSVDRRAGLKNRLGTALSPAGEDTLNEIAVALRADAAERLRSLVAARVYPLRFGRVQGVALAVGLLAGVVALLGNRPIVLSPAERAKAADNANAAAAIQRVLEPYHDATPKAPHGKLELKEVAALEKLKRDLESGETDRESALQRANKALKDAKNLEAQAAQQVKAQLSKAVMPTQALTQANSGDPSAAMAASLQKQAGDVQRQIDDLKRELQSASKSEAGALKAEIAGLNAQKAGLDQAAAEAAQAAAAFQSAEQQDDLRQIEDALRVDSMSADGGSSPFAEFLALKSRLMATIQSEIANIKVRLKTATGAEAQRLREKLAQLEGQLAAAKAQVDAYNKALRAAAKAIKTRRTQAAPEVPQMHTRFNSAMRTAMAKLLQSLNKIESGDDLSPAESKALQHVALQMDAEASRASKAGDKERAMTAGVLADAARSLADGDAAIALAMAGRDGLGYGGPSPAELSQGSGGKDLVSTKDEHNVHKVNHLAKPTPGRGKTTPTVVDPLRGEGPESYIEIKGPATLGGRSAIPYRSVLPSYRRSEESALTQGKIPKKYQKRVRAYFDSLNGR